MSTADARPVTDLPQIIEPTDLALYQEIFTEQEKGHWKTADRLIKKLQDRTLMGHVLAQRYLHPTKYRSRYKELRRWLLKYHDHPQAKRIYALGKKRKPANALGLRAPSGGYLGGSGYDATGYASKVYSPRKKLSRADARTAKSYKRKMRYYTRKGWTKSVKRLLHSKDVHRVLHRGQIDQARTWLAAGYYAAGRDQWALDWATKAMKRSGRYIPTSYWVAGLASWRMGKLNEAAQYFEKVTQSDYASDWMISAGAYWAARAYLIERKPALVNQWLTAAAHHPRTFYGQLANRALGYEAVFDWTVPEINENDLLALKLQDSGRRALALLQVGQDEMAEKEFRKAYGKSDIAAKNAMLAIAMRTNMPSFSMRLANSLNRKGEAIPVAALYPLPKWQPKNGFEVDRALIYALMRQESGFNPKAKSHAGAMGLMQLMPGTASYVAKDRRMRWSKKVYDPETNINLGQDYIKILLEKGHIEGDLFHLAAAWNGGPGNLNKWKRSIQHNDDPLLFIESIPSRETRIFIERVLTNFWVYRDRLGQTSPTLDQIASGSWPTYISQEEPNMELVQRQSIIKN